MLYANLFRPADSTAGLLLFHQGSVKKVRDRLAPFRRSTTAMRLVSVLILVAIVGGIGYVLVFKRDWLFQKVEEGTRLAQGYSAAKTPSDAMDLFRKAVKDRDYKTAATYCMGDYAEQLTKGHDAGRAVGKLIDGIVNFMENKGLKTEKAMTALYSLDPFPGNFKVKDAPQKKDDAKAIGQFELEPISNVNLLVMQQIGNVDPLMFKHNLAPLDIRVVEINQTGKGKENAWKLNFPLQPGQVQLISHFLDHHKTYVTGLERFRTELTNERYGSKREFENQLIQVLADANVK
jgi:hypothetical protein